MAYVSKVIPLSKLILDPKNPRFVSVPSPNDESIKNYLIQYEDVLTIVKGINEDGGLMPGERIIVCKENGKYIVLEGNRRICSCKLLLGQLKTDRKIPKVTEETEKNIRNINVDIVENRQSVQVTLYKRHIKGVRGWSTQAKLSFFASRYINGETIEQISDDTGSTPGDVRTSIQKYKLLHYALELPLWREIELNSLDPLNIDIDRFLRVFYSNSKFYEKKTARILLKLSFDSELNPISSYGKGNLDKGLYYIAKAAFLTGILSTRDHVEVIPEFNILMDELENQENNNFSGSTYSNDEIHEDIESDESAEVQNKDQKNDTVAPIDQTEQSTDVIEREEIDQSVTLDGDKSGNEQANNPKAFVFFEALKWNALQSNASQDIGLMHLAQEIQKLSKYKHFSWYPISATILLRSLLEQSLKFYIRKMGHWQLLTTNNQNKDPMLSQLIRYYKHNNRYELLFVEKKYYSAFLNTVVDENITFLDTVVHSTETILPSREKLDSLAKCGMYILIEYILNEKKHWPTP